ncbi:MAG: fimbrial protein FimV, partial [Rhodanobacteraceae bacterium]
MKSALKLTAVIALVLGSAPAPALQLGAIQVKSALDEPLVAEIPIQLDNLSEAKDLRVQLASATDFAKAGLSRAGLEHLNFSIVSDSTGHKLVLVTSEQPVSDPYLDFLLELDTPKGKQLREYTVLLDPVIASTPPEEAAAPAPQAAIAPVTSPPVESGQPAPSAPSVSSAPVQQPTAAPWPAPVQPAEPPLARAATPATPPRA